MRVAVLCLLSVCLVYHVTEATIALTVGGLALTAAQTTALVGVGSLLAAKGLLIGGLLARRGRRRSHSRGRSYGRRYRGRRESQDQQEQEMTVEVLAKLEPKDCFKRIMCAAATGRLGSHELRSSLEVLNEALVVDPAHPATSKYRAAAVYGLQRSITKCEFKYECDLSMDELSSIFI